MAKAKAPVKVPNVYSYPVEGGVRWYYKVTLTIGGQRKVFVKKNFSTQAEAAEALKVLRAQDTLNQVTVSSKMPLGDFLDKWWLRHQRTQADGGSYEQHIRLHIKPWIGSVPLAGLTSDVVSDFLSDLGDHGGKNGKPLSYSTVSKVRSVLHVAMQKAVKEKLVPV